MVLRVCFIGESGTCEGWRARRDHVVEREARHMAFLTSIEELRKQVKGEYGDRKDTHTCKVREKGKTQGYDLRGKEMKRGKK